MSDLILNAIKSSSPVDEKQKKQVMSLDNFWWDNVIFTMITLLLVITSAQSIAAYFRGGINCLITESHTIAERAYINDLCREELPNYAKYFPLALYAEVALLSGLQTFWRILRNGRIEYFITAVNSMSFKRNPKTGQYDSTDLDTARILGGKLHSASLTLSYIFLKLFLQIVIATIGLFMTFIEELNFEFELRLSSSLSFVCQNSSFSNSSLWPLSSSEIHCVYTELSILQYLPWINVAATVIIIISAIAGLVLLSLRLLKRDYKIISEYMLHYGLKKYELRRILFCNWSLPCTKKAVSLDLAFLISKLYVTNHKIGEAVFLLLIHCHLNHLTENINAERSPKRGNLVKWITG